MDPGHIGRGSRRCGSREATQTGVRPSHAHKQVHAPHPRVYDVAGGRIIHGSMLTGDRANVGNAAAHLTRRPAVGRSTCQLQLRRKIASRSSQRRAHDGHYGREQLMISRAIGIAIWSWRAADSAAPDRPGAGQLSD